MVYDIPRLYRLMLEKGWPVLDLSRRSGVPETTLRGMFERNSAHPQTVKAVAEVFNLELKDLIIEAVTEPSEKRA